MTMSHLICDKDAPSSVRASGRQAKKVRTICRQIAVSHRLAEEEAGQGQDDHYKNSLWSLFSPPLHVVVAAVAVAGCHLFVFLCA